MTCGIEMFGVLYFIHILYSVNLVELVLKASFKIGPNMYINHLIMILYGCLLSHTKLWPESCPGFMIGECLILILISRRGCIFSQIDRKSLPANSLVSASPSQETDFVRIVGALQQILSNFGPKAPIQAVFCCRSDHLALVDCVPEPRGRNLAPSI